MGDQTDCHEVFERTVPDSPTGASVSGKEGHTLAESSSGETSLRRRVDLF